MDEEEYWLKIKAGANRLLDGQSSEGLNKAYQLSKQRVGFIGQHMTPSEAFSLAVCFVDLPGMHEGLMALNELAAKEKNLGFMALQALMFLGILTLSVAEVRLEEQIEKVTEGQKELPN